MQGQAQIDIQVVHGIFGGIRSALYSRGLCRRLKDGNVQEVQFLGYLPRPDLGAVTFVVDTMRITQTVKLEKLYDPNVIHQISTNLGGRRVVATNTRRLAYTVAVRPPEPRPRLPRSVRLDLQSRPAGQYVIPIGEGRKGPVWISLLQSGHVLVGGLPGYGKSTSCAVCWPRC